jgi:hypothetical protein
MRDTQEGEPNNVARVDLRDRIRLDVLGHLKQLGLSIEGKSLANQNENQDKESIRKIHSLQRTRALDRDRDFLGKLGTSVLKNFASGKEIEPTKITPTLELVETGQESADIFRVACLSWSVPVSKGFGRRIRCLVRDGNNGKVMGILGITDPVFNLRARDTWIGWNQQQRRESLINVMDAFVLGALPPYSSLICGKLVASVVTSTELAKIFAHKYYKSESVIKKRTISPRLALVTTTSALGRSSIYNRLKFKNRLLFIPLGMTEGYGHFHFPEPIIEKMRSFLRRSHHKYADGHKFGAGPNWRMRLIREALHRVGLPPDILCHGVKRQVFAVPLLKNTKEFLRGEHKRIRSDYLPLSDLASFCLERWILPRAGKNTFYREFDVQYWRQLLALEPDDSRHSDAADPIAVSFPEAQYASVGWPFVEKPIGVNAKPTN